MRDTIHVYIQSKSGDANRDLVVERGSSKLTGEFRDFEMVVKTILGTGGYYTESRSGNRRFVPLHEIDYIEDQTPE